MVLRLRVGAVFQQEPDYFRPAEVACLMERRLAIPVDRVHVAASLYQGTNNFDSALVGTACPVEGRPVKRVCRINLRPRVEKEPDYLGRTCRTSLTQKFIINTYKIGTGRFLEKLFCSTGIVIFYGPVEFQFELGIGGSGIGFRVH
jgi:hypothetical protein